MPLALSRGIVMMGVAARERKLGNILLGVMIQGKRLRNVGVKTFYTVVCTRYGLLRNVV